MDSTHISEGDRVRIKPGTPNVPKEWWERSGIAIEVETSPANPRIGLQARIQFESGGLEPVVPLDCLEPAQT